MNDSRPMKLERRRWNWQLLAFATLVLLGSLASPASARMLLHCDLDAPTPPPLPPAPPTVVTTAQCIDQGGMAKSVTVGGNPTWGDGRPGNGTQNGRAVVFDGTGDYLLLTGSPLLNGLRQLTVQAWVQVTGSPTNIFRVQQPVGLDGNRAVVRNSQQGSPWFSLASGSPAPTGWYHVATVFDRGELRFYINGRLSNVSIIDIEEIASAVNYTDWALGARFLSGSADQFFAGSIDEVTVHDEALPAETLLKNARNSVLTVTHDVTVGPNPAFGDGATDDAQAIQDRLNAAAAGGDEVYIPSGIYRLGKTLQMPPGILVRGEEDTILEPIENLIQPVNPIFAFDDFSMQGAAVPVVESTLRDLQIRGRSSEIAQNFGHAAVILTGTQRCHIDGLKVSDLGHTTATRGGIQILLQSLSLGSKPGVGRDSVGNVIENNHLDDSGQLGSFGIRFGTLWLDEERSIVPPPVTVFARSNVAKDNHLEGFLQGIEIAGPGTEKNWIRGNVSTGAVFVGVEADKGAKQNILVDNFIRQPRNPNPVVLSGMRDQGFVKCDGESIAFEFFASGNVFRRNVIMDVRNVQNAGGIFLSRTEFGIFEDNFVRDIAQSGQGSAAVLSRDSTVSNYTIVGNQTSDTPGSPDAPVTVMASDCKTVP